MCARYWVDCGATGVRANIRDHCAGLCFRDQLRSHNCGGELSGQARVDGVEFADGNGFERCYLKRACGDEALESGDGHLVEPALDLAKSSGAVGTNVRAPAYESAFGKEDVRPGKDAEEVSAERVVPGWSEAGHDASSGLEQVVHDVEDGCRVAEVFEGIERDDDVGFCVCMD